MKKQRLDGFINTTDCAPAAGRFFDGFKGGGGRAGT